MKLRKDNSYTIEENSELDVANEVLGKKSFNKSEVKQNDALVIFASSLE